MSSVTFQASDSGVYYVGVFDINGNFLNSNYFQSTPHGNNDIWYNVNNYMVLIYTDYQNFYLCNILLADTYLSSTSIITVTLDTTNMTNPQKIINFSSVTNNTIILTKANTPINNYCTPINNSTDAANCSSNFFIFGDMSNSQAGPRNSMFYQGHNICVNPSLYTYIVNISQPPTTPTTTTPTTTTPTTTTPTTTTPTTMTPTTTNNNDWIYWLIFAIAILIIILIILFTVGYFYKKKKANELWKS
jgi:hypothetical protein